MPGSTPMIEADGLTKFYAGFPAIQRVSFSIQAREVVAFLGPNGAGKSTTMKILTGYLAASSGRARIAGLDVATRRLQAAEKIGYLPENGPIYPEMTPREFLRFFGEARGLRKLFKGRLDAVTETCALASVLDKPLSKLSKGYRQRVGMAQVLLHEPASKPDPAFPIHLHGKALGWHLVPERNGDGELTCGNRPNTHLHGALELILPSARELFRSRESFDEYVGIQQQVPDDLARALKGEATLNNHGRSFTPYSLLTAYCSLLTAHCLLLTAY